MKKCGVIISTDKLNYFSSVLPELVTRGQENDGGILQVPKFISICSQEHRRTNETRALYYTKTKIHSL